MSNTLFDRRGASLAVTTILLTAIYQATWYVAPQLLALPLWSGSALNVGFILGTLSIAVPILTAWLMVRDDRAATPSEQYETNNH